MKTLDMMSLKNLDNELDFQWAFDRYRILLTGGRNRRLTEQELQELRHLDTLLRKEVKHHT